MYEIRVKRKFKKDLKRIAKRGKDIDKLETVIDALQQGRSLPKKHKAHQLKGLWKPCWECHVESDWLLIWDISENESQLILIRTGTRADLFD